MYKNKGFTLVELLAVIVILALLIVITANTVLPMMNKTKINAMIVYAEKVLDKASAAYMIDSMSDVSAKNYSISALMGQDDYFGVVRVEMNGNNYLYSISMFDAKAGLGLKDKYMTSTIIESSADELVSKDNFVSSDTADAYDTDDKVVDYEFIYSANKNLIDISKVPEENSFVNATSGNISNMPVEATKFYRHSDYIHVTSGKQYKYHYGTYLDSPSVGIAWYDSSKKFINGESFNSFDSSSPTDLVAPSNAMYIRVSWPIHNNSNWKYNVKLYEIN